MNPALVTVGNLVCAKTEEEALAKGLPGAGFFGFALGYTNGRVDYGRHHIFREYQARRQAEEAAGRTTVATAEPQDETQRTLFRAGRRGNFMGTPDFIRENLREYEDAHLDCMLFFVQCGDRRHEDIMDSLDLFGRTVMPEFLERHHLQQKWREQQLDGVRFPINSSI
jgi:alkanesulfonate monooxygenase SsuD/methylene tetrahydromethanopterin reductase-like flavin-dependent oxidoreductase (luciferase family)